MRTKGWTRVLAVAAVAATMGIASRADAQRVLDSVNVIAPRTKADTLAFKAEALQSKPSTMRQAAYLYQLAASMRDQDDVRAHQNLALASHLLYYVGDVGAARSSMERAAHRALYLGDVMSAATAYIDASFLSLELGSTGRAASLGRKAQQLASSPLLSAAQRATLEQRLGTPAMVGLLSDR